MALAIAATLNVGSRAVDLVVTGATNGTLYSVRRQISENGTDYVDSGGVPRYYVRGWRNFDPADFTTGIDVDFPQNIYLKYTVQAVGGGASATSAAVGPIDLGADFIISTGSTAVGVPVLVESVPEQVNHSQSSVMKVLGRRDPVVVGDFRQYPTFDLPIWTLGQNNRTYLRTLLDSYAVVTFSPRYPRDMGDIICAYHVSVGDYTFKRPTTSDAPVLWTLPCSQVGAPSTTRTTALNTSTAVGPAWDSAPNLAA